MERLWRSANARHFILRGPPGTPYEDGEYWGQLQFPGDYPFKPPYAAAARGL